MLDPTLLGLVIVAPALVLFTSAWNRLPRRGTRTESDYKGEMWYWKSDIGLDVYLMGLASLVASLAANLELLKQGGWIAILVYGVYSTVVSRLYRDENEVVREDWRNKCMWTGIGGCACAVGFAFLSLLLF